MKSRKALLALVLQAFLTSIAFVALSPAARAAPEPNVLADKQCLACHEVPQVMGILKTHHGAAGNANAPTCTTCHGASTAHMKDPGATKPDRTFTKGTKTPVKERTAVCLACHGTDRHLAFWDSGFHARNGVTCADCHDIHAPKNLTLRKDDPNIAPYQTTQRQLQYETCVRCHKDIRAQILKPSHHPIIEGKLACTSCHNPHGALTPDMIKADTPRDLCTSCHSEKRGPFIFEHPPVEENCLTCHSPHGSNHNYLLNEKVPSLCQNCHDSTRHPGTPYGANAGFAGPIRKLQFIGMGCVNCHSQIHGSNGAPGRGEFFLR